MRSEDQGKSTNADLNIRNMKEKSNKGLFLFFWLNIWNILTIHFLINGKPSRPVLWSLSVQRCSLRVVSATYYFLKFASPLSPRPWFALAKCRGCTFATQTSQINGEHNHSICHTQIWISQCVWREEERRTGKMSDFSLNQCLSTALRSSLTGKGIHTHLAAIVGSKMTNHNIIDVLKKPDYRRQKHWQPLLPSREKELIWSWWHQSLFQAPFQASSSSCGWKSKRWEAEREREEGEKNDKKGRYYVSILGLRGVSELPWIAIHAFVHSYIDPRSGKWALGQCEALDLELELEQE